VSASLALADSAVQSVAEGSQEGTVAVDGTDVPVRGLGTAAFQDAGAFDLAGAADSAKAEALAASDAVRAALSASLDEVFARQPADPAEQDIRIKDVVGALSAVWVALGGRPAQG